MPTRPITGPLTRSPSGGVTGVGGLSLPEVARMVTVVSGNSIAAQAKYSTDKWFWDGEIQVANLFCRAAMKFGVMTATLRTDKYGVYGYSGQRLDTINADIGAQWISPINAAGITPGLVIGLALLENDLAQASAYADMVSRVNTWLSTVQTAWPSAKVLICTPRPSTSYNTPQIVADYQAISNYILGLANNRTIFTAQLNGYEDPASAGQPLAGYTADGVHPNLKGAMKNARVIAAAVRRIGLLTPSETIQSSNRTLTGSAAATGTGVSGTKPTGAGTAGTTGLTTVSEALNPGWMMTVSGSGVVATWFANCTTNTIAGSPPLISPYTVIRLGAGAQNLRIIQADPRITDGGGNTFRQHLVMRGQDVDAEFIEGDELTFLEPPHAPNSGAITAETTYFTVQMKATSSPATFTVIEQGWTTP